ncbi:hypothetical protein [Brucella lupini]|nr:hypothetical protein [Brucella lupini]KAB2699916.1 hypothetical protein F9L03_24910 [Brucella lupini]
MKKAVKTSSSSLKSTLSELKTHVEGYGDASANKSVREIIKAIQPAPVAKLGVSTTGKSKAAITSNKLPSAERKSPNRISPVEVKSPASVNNKPETQRRSRASTVLGNAGAPDSTVVEDRKKESGDYLTEKFENLSFVKSWRLLVKRAMSKIPSEYADTVTMPDECTKAARCKSGFCPICMRLLRKKLLKFTKVKKFQCREWHFVTIVVEQWLKAPGDYTPFGKLKDQPAIKNLLLGIHRLKRPDVLLIGGIETVFNVMNNIPSGKPFHLHLMVSGLTREELSNLIKKHIPDTHLPRSVRFDRVGDKPSDFPDAVSYVCMQPFWRKSKNDNSGSGWFQTPKSTDFAELMCNLGTHQWGDRFFFIGMKFHYGQFKLT